MKYKTVLIACLLLCNYTSNSRTELKNNKIKKITVKSTNMLEKVEFLVDCNSFDEIFPNAIIYNITDTNLIQDVVNNNNEAELNAFQQFNLDVRAKIFITFHSGQVDTLCIGLFHDYSLNGKEMKFNSLKLREMLDSLYHIESGGR